MDGRPRQNPAYRPATEQAPATGLVLSGRPSPPGASGRPCPAAARRQPAPRAARNGQRRATQGDAVGFSGSARARTRPGGPAMSPRWEWRTLSERSDDAERRFETYPPKTVAESDEQYLLSL